MNKMCNVIDRALLRNGIMRQAAFIAPPSYYGFDMIIPVVSDNSKVTGNPIYTFIGIQSKAGKESMPKIIQKMPASLHYVPCPLHSECDSSTCQHVMPSEGLKSIFQNQIVIVASAAGKNEEKEVADSRKVTCRAYGTTSETASKVFSELFPNWCHAPESVISDGNSLAVGPSNSICKYASIYLDQGIRLAKMMFEVHNEITCIWLNDLAVFEKVVDRSVLEVAEQIVDI